MFGLSHYFHKTRPHAVLSPDYLELFKELWLWLASPSHLCSIIVFVLFFSFLAIAINRLNEEFCLSGGQFARSFYEVIKRWPTILDWEKPSSLDTLQVLLTEFASKTSSTASESSVFWPTWSYLILLDCRVFYNPYETSLTLYLLFSVQMRLHFSNNKCIWLLLWSYDPVQTHKDKLVN